MLPHPRIRRGSVLALVLALASCSSGGSSSSVTTPGLQAGQVDLSVSKTVDDDRPAEGDQVVFTLVVACDPQGADATGVRLADLLPAGLTYASHAAGQGTYDPGTGQWTVGALASGDQAVLDIAATVDPGTGGTQIVNRAEGLVADQADPVAGNDADEAALEVSDATNLSLAKTVDSPTAAEGESVFFTVTLLNEGPALATNVVVQDLLPPGLTYAFHSSTVGGYDAQTGVWSVAALIPGFAQTLDVEAIVDAGTGGSTLVNTAALAALDQTDSDAGDDSASASVSVDPAANLAVALAVEPQSAVRRQPVELRARVENLAGGALATGVVLAVPLPVGLTLESSSATAGGYDGASALWTVGDLAAGGAQELVLVATVDPGTAPGALAASAGVTASQRPDPDPANDAAQAVLDVVADSVDVVRDAWGVAHVFAASDQGAFFGMGWATARDRLSQLLWRRAQIRGRLAEHFGRGADDELLLSDRRARAYGWARRAEAHVPLVDPETRSFLESYADGVNAWMTSPGAALHPALASLPLEPWTAADCVLLWFDLGRFFSQPETNEAVLLHLYEDLVDGGVSPAQAIAQLTPSPVYDESAPVVLESDVPPAVRQAMQDYADEHAVVAAPAMAAGEVAHFSHAWALPSSMTDDGLPVLVSDPRLPITRPTTLYEIHVQGATFDVRGAGPPGTLHVMTGSTPALAWGVTSSSLDQTDLFRIHTDASEPGKYRLNGAFVPFVVDETESIAILGESPDALVYRETVFGPLVTEFTKDVRHGEHYASRHVSSFLPERDPLEGFVAMYRAGDAFAFGDALEGWIYPSANVVFVDAGGHVGFWSNGSVPLRSTEAGLAPLAGVAALEGDDLRNDWQEIVPHDLMPWVIDPAAGPVFSANHAPVGSWYPIPLGGIPQDSTGESDRSRRLRELLVGPASFSAAAVEDIRRDPVPTGVRDVVRLALYARDVLGAPLSPSTLDALAELGPWLQAGGELLAVERGVLVATAMEEGFRPPQATNLIPIWGGGNSGAHFFLKTHVGELDGTGSTALDADELNYLDTVIRVAYDKVVAAVGLPSMTWLPDYEVQIQTLQLPAWTDLNGFESLDPTDVLAVGPVDVGGRRTLASQPGAAYSAVVRPGTVDQGLSVLPPGEGEPGAPGETSQVPVFEHRDLRPAPTTRPGIEALAGPTSTTTLSY